MNSDSGQERIKGLKTLKRTLMLMEKEERSLFAVLQTVQRQCDG
jgi:hypothetical protein